LKNFSPQSWHEANQEIIVCRNRRIDQDVVTCREVVISKSRGMLRDGAYCTRLYSPRRIEGMLRSVGFASVITQKGFLPREKDGDYGIMTNRMVVIAHKS
jgi:hypothetical protein